jgi:hypothetical protein
MARKNISIGVDTWEALAALGKFGQTFDDIIQLLLKEHNELKQTGQKPQEQQPQGEKIPIKSYERMMSSKGLKFPINKADFVEYIKRFTDNEIDMAFARNIPDKTFRNKPELEAHLQKYILRDHR